MKQIHNQCYLFLTHLPVDLNRLHEDVKRYSCTPRNYSVNLREELKATNAVFFPRCLLVKQCGGNCGCGTDNWKNGCTCEASKKTLKLHEVRRAQRGRTWDNTPVLWSLLTPICRQAACKSFVDIHTVRINLSQKGIRYILFFHSFYFPGSKSDEWNSKCYCY